MENKLKERLKIFGENIKVCKEIKEKCPYSVSKIVDLCKAEFDKNKMAKHCFEKYYNDEKSTYYHKTVEEILEMWQEKAKNGMENGKKLDSFIGSILNKDEICEKRLYENCQNDIIKRKYNTFKYMYEKEFIKNNFDFICREGTIYDTKHKWSGRFDAIFVKNNEIILIDWKNNEKITTENKFSNMRGPMYRYESSDLNGYTIQLYLYKYALRNIFGFNDVNIKTIICRIGEGEYEFFKPTIEYSDELMEDIIEYALSKLEKDKYKKRKI